MSGEWEAVIGLEVHIELATRTKMFSACPTDFGGEPNTRVTPVDLGLPGTLPVVNGRAIAHAVRLGLALGCDIAPTSVFHRKNYFYPDMPKNYQISQYDVPICSGGRLDVTVDSQAHRIGITRVHMEEDTGKTTHVGTSGRIHGAAYSLVDYNRAGIPLLECVSEPDIRTPEQAQAYLTELRAIVLALGISDAKLEEGSMRCDANVSVHRPGTPFGTRCEIKNLNSVRSLGRAIAYEAARQADVLEGGGTIELETRHWDEDAGVTHTLRRKETLADYRYFPDPDLVEVHADPEWVEQLRATLPELPAATRRRLADAGVDAETAVRLHEAGLVAPFDAAVAAGASAVEAAKWLTNEVSAWQNETGRDAAAHLSGAQLAELLALLDDGTLSVKLARRTLVRVLAGAGSPREVAEAEGYVQLTDEGAVAALVDQVLAEQPDTAESVRLGNRKALGALVGGVMRLSAGKADPALVNRLLAAKLIHQVDDPHS